MHAARLDPLKLLIRKYPEAINEWIWIGDLILRRSLVAQERASLIRIDGDPWFVPPNLDLLDFLFVKSQEDIFKNIMRYL